MKKLLFLDIDGVLNSSAWLKECYDANLPYTALDPDLVKKLNVLDCEVVISSSWGWDEGRTLKKLRDSGLSLAVIGSTEHHEIGSYWIVRGNSIKKWLEDNMRLLDYQYAILDDDSDMLLEQKSHFVHVDSTIGLTDGDAKRIQEILDSGII